MALSPEFSISISSDRTTVTITDDTVYGTGGNPARADLRVFVKGYKVDSEHHHRDNFHRGRRRP
jgi:hypothetical protein